MYSAHQVRSKTRLAIKRREEQVEQEEIEGGELNLIPYLDIVTNLMLFLLASVTASVLLGQINTLLPSAAPPGASSVDKPETKPEDQPLVLIVSVTRDNILLHSATGRVGSIGNYDLVLPRVGYDEDQCDGGYMCESGYCDEKRGVCAPNPELDDEGRPPPRLPVFDYRKLNDRLYQIASTYYRGKTRRYDTYQALLQPDETTPYETLISIMSAMRCKMPPFGEKIDRCFLPSVDETMTTAAEPEDELNRLYDTARVQYDPDRHALFSDIVFSPGYE
jgi:biopolymer transport protein ExbD